MDPNHGHSRRQNPYSQPWYNSTSTAANQPIATSLTQPAAAPPQQPWTRVSYQVPPSSWTPAYPIPHFQSGYPSQYGHSSQYGQQPIPYDIQEPPYFPSPGMGFGSSGLQQQYLPPPYPHYAMPSHSTTMPNNRPSALPYFQGPPSHPSPPKTPKGPNCMPRKRDIVDLTDSPPLAPANIPVLSAPCIPRPLHQKAADNGKDAKKPKAGIGGEDESYLLALQLQAQFDNEELQTAKDLEFGQQLAQIEDPADAFWGMDDDARYAGELQVGFDRKSKSNKKLETASSDSATVVDLETRGQKIDFIAAKKTLQTFTQKISNKSCFHCGEVLVRDAKEIPQLMMMIDFGKNDLPDVLLQCKSCSGITCSGCGSNAQHSNTNGAGGQSREWCCAESRLLAIWVILYAWELQCQSAVLDNKKKLAAGNSGVRRTRNHSHRPKGVGYGGIENHAIPSFSEDWYSPPLPPFSMLASTQASTHGQNMSTASSSKQGYVQPHTTPKPPLGNPPHYWKIRHEPPLPYSGGLNTLSKMQPHPAKLLADEMEAPAVQRSVRSQSLSSGHNWNTGSNDNPQPPKRPNEWVDEYLPWPVPPSGALPSLSGPSNSNHQPVQNNQAFGSYPQPLPYFNPPYIPGAGHYYGGPYVGAPANLASKTLKDRKRSIEKTAFAGSEDVTNAWSGKTRAASEQLNSQPAALASSGIGPSDKPAFHGYANSPSPPPFYSDSNDMDWEFNSTLSWPSDLDGRFDDDMAISDAGAVHQPSTSLASNIFSPAHTAQLVSNGPFNNQGKSSEQKQGFSHTNPAASQFLHTPSSAPLHEETSIQSNAVKPEPHVNIHKKMALLHQRMAPHVEVYHKMRERRMKERQNVYRPDASAKAATAAHDKRTLNLFELLCQVLPSPERGTTFDLEPPAEIFAMIALSSVMDEAAELLRNDSIEDANKRSRVYHALINFVSKVGSSHATSDTILKERPSKACREDFFYSSTANSKSAEATEHVASIAASMKNLVVQSGVILGQVKRRPDDFLGDEEQDMLLLCTRMLELADEVSKWSSQAEGAEKKRAMSKGQEWQEWQRANCMLEVPDDVMFRGHGFATEAQKSTQAPKGRMKRLVEEGANLSTSLPPGIFVKFASSRPDVLKALIVGPADTPYEGGLFEFDVWCPPEYPNVPPRFRFRTTGRGRGRFNPNLYEDGKVCLSLLNTWQGERWNPNVSTLLQVLVSLQSMVFCDRPYYNEPGHEYSGSTSEAARYDAKVQGLTVRLGLIEWLQGGSKTVWADVVKAHFSQNGIHVLGVAKRWAKGNKEIHPKDINELEKLLSDSGAARSLI